MRNGADGQWEAIMIWEEGQPARAQGGWGMISCVVLGVAQGSGHLLHSGGAELTRIVM